METVLQGELGGRRTLCVSGRYYNIWEERQGTPEELPRSVNEFSASKVEDGYKETLHITEGSQILWAHHMGRP